MAHCNLDKRVAAPESSSGPCWRHHRLREVRKLVRKSFRRKMSSIRARTGSQLRSTSMHRIRTRPRNGSGISSQYKHFPHSLHQRDLNSGPRTPSFKAVSWVLPVFEEDIAWPSDNLIDETANEASQASAREALSTPFYGLECASRLLFDAELEHDATQPVKIASTYSDILPSLGSFFVDTEMHYRSIFYSWDDDQWLEWSLQLLHRPSITKVRDQVNEPVFLSCALLARSLRRKEMLAAQSQRYKLYQRIKICYPLVPDTHSRSSKEELIQFQVRDESWSAAKFHLWRCKAGKKKEWRCYPMLKSLDARCSSTYAFKMALRIGVNSKALHNLPCCALRRTAECKPMRARDIKLRNVALQDALLMCSITMKDPESCRDDLLVDVEEEADFPFSSDLELESICAAKDYLVTTETLLTDFDTNTRRRKSRLKLSDDCYIGAIIASRFRILNLLRQENHYDIYNVEDLLAPYNDCEARAYDFRALNTRRRWGRMRNLKRFSAKLLFLCSVYHCGRLFAFVKKNDPKTHLQQIVNLNPKSQQLGRRIFIMPTTEMASVSSRTLKKP